ncbi:hypothetical protein QAD02_003320 [Eretmocerus hayati]|uniref:Uncharacterized protein n=1 Tax=Eretmocerus hayati TaxID=131215 RepID=A0ACC2NMC7_9HYME|nr:hypothetical protein QAD02_003320 [Eretmocerus hayati]
MGRVKALKCHFFPVLGLGGVSSNAEFETVATQETSRLPLELSGSSGCPENATQTDTRVNLRPPSDAIKVPAKYPSSGRSTYTTASMPVAQSDMNLSRDLLQGQMEYGGISPPFLTQQFPSPSFLDQDTSRGHNASYPETGHWNPPVLPRFYPQSQHPTWGYRSSFPEYSQHHWYTYSHAPAPVQRCSSYMGNAHLEPPFRGMQLHAGSKWPHEDDRAYRSTGQKRRKRYRPKDKKGNDVLITSTHLITR